MATGTIPSTSITTEDAEFSTMQLEQFTLFPELPIELRLKIWKLSFVPRHINLNIRPAMKALDNDQRHPVALSINRESRTETFKRYCVLSPSKVAFKTGDGFWPIHQAPIFLNPDIDSAFLDLGLLEWGCCNATTWLSYVEIEIPGGFKVFRELELTGAHVTPKFKAGFEAEGGWGRVLLKFSGLQKLYITSYGGDWGYCSTESASEQKQLEDCRDVIETFLKGHKTTYTRDKIPEIVVDRFAG